MLVWLENQPGAEVECPFCSHGSPTYLTQFSPPKMIMCHDQPQTNRTLFDDARHPGATLPGDGDWASPFVHEFFMVQGSGFRCMAYRNQDGKWRGAFDHAELPGAIRVLE
jgi:hypothetical protein